MKRSTLLLGLGLVAAWAMGSRRTSAAAGSQAHIEPGGIGPGGAGPGGELPVSDRMTFDDACQNLMVQVSMEDYDRRITTRYWELRQAGWCNPTEISAELLRMDAPQCAWPPGDDASEQAKIIWLGTHQAVANFMSMEDPKLHNEGLPYPCP